MQWYQSFVNLNWLLEDMVYWPYDPFLRDTSIGTIVNSSGHPGKPMTSWLTVAISDGAYASFEFHE